ALAEDAATGRRLESFGRSEEKGLFRVGQLGKGPYELEIQARGYAEKTIAEVQVDRDVRVELDPLGIIEGQVVSAMGGFPVVEFEINLRPRLAPGRGTAGGERG